MTKIRILKFIPEDMLKKEGIFFVSSLALEDNGLRPTIIDDDVAGISYVSFFRERDAPDKRGGGN